MTNNDDSGVDHVERIRQLALEAKTLDDLAIVLRDAGEVILWLHTIVGAAVGQSLYLKHLEAAALSDEVSVDRWLHSDSHNAHFRDQGDKDSPVRASEGNSRQLDAVVAARNALYGAQWSVRAAAELIRPGVEFDGDRSHHLK